jgi:hypothetical protein
VHKRKIVCGPVSNYDRGNIKKIIGSISKQEIISVTSITGFSWEEVERILLEITR